jgi:hypothetical protein
MELLMARVATLLSVVLQRYVLRDLHFYRRRVRYLSLAILQIHVPLADLVPFL